MTDQSLENSLLTPEACERAADSIMKNIESRLKHLSDLHTPYWDARNDVLKNLIQLASGSIILTVTFSSSLLKPGVAWKLSLFGSWISFLASIIAAVLSLWLSTRIRTVPVAFHNQRGKIVNALKGKSRNRISDITDEVAELIMRDIPKYDLSEKYVTRCLHVSLLFFILGLILLGVFGARVLDN